ncbi:YiiX/YebB-like N1pC/P60 family cysteine hydrolase [Taibaiella koreensis]|uniref:YiiX/YebB-like N1pC/P60 family cysteine hydrolase n=1 Tax=Taibaiella koreensis TaxID=1268548 RepID=UPI000E59D3E7|nr:YiiX/YebB-like N1pC/P60 family cysteine hydrolase [Taibaiella koreensis]
MSQNTEHKNRKLHAGLLILMLLLFVAAYNRRWIRNELDPQPLVAEVMPGDRRAANPWNSTRADSCIRIVRNGDLVLRAGSDAISALFKRVNTRDKTYSHAGIVFIENGYPFVYNCIGSAANPDALLRRDSLYAYITPADNLGYAVYRYQLRPAQIEKLYAVAVRYFKERRRFDPHFDLSTDSALYCTEFVYKALQETTGDKKYLPLTEASGYSFVSVDNLFSRKDISLVCRIGYIQ